VHVMSTLQQGAFARHAAYTHWIQALSSMLSSRICCLGRECLLHDCWLRVPDYLLLCICVVGCGVCGKYSSGSGFYMQVREGVHQLLAHPSPCVHVSVPCRRSRTTSRTRLAKTRCFTLSLWRSKISGTT